MLAAPAPRPRRITVGDPDDDDVDVDDDYMEDDQGSTSDSDVGAATNPRRPKPKPKKTTPAPRPAAAKKRATPPVARKQAIAGSRQKNMYVHNLAKQPDPSKIVRLPDFLSMGELNADLLADLDEMYGPTRWDDATVEELPLFRVDTEERKHRDMRAKNVFDNPKVFTVIQKMLQRHPKNSPTFSMQELQLEIANLYTIESVPRWYEESLLRNPRDTENPCCNGEACLAKTWFGFIMAEFITPLELAEIKESGTRESATKMCLLCLRKSVEFLQTSYIVGNLRNPENYVNQTHRNEVNKKGEYTFEYSIPLGNGIIYPMIMNHKLAYTVWKEGDRWWLTQPGYPDCTQEDIDKQNFSSGTLQQNTLASARPGGEEEWEEEQEEQGAGDL